MLGTFTLWFGWYGFNAGSGLLHDNAEIVVPLAAVNTTLAGGTAGIVALFVNLVLLERYTGEPVFDLKYLMNGALSGLVASTGPCGVMEPWAAVVVGAVAALLYIFGSWALIKLKLDDAVDAIPVHMVNGAWGAFATGLFASPGRLKDAYGHSNHPGLFYGGDGSLLGAQCVGILFIFGWVVAIMLPFFIVLDMMGWLRSDPLDEIIGLDTSYHGGCMLGTRNEKVGPEHIAAMQKRKKDKKSRRRQHLGVGDASGELEDIEEEDSHYFDT
jgi:ammonium transporter, Amt family